MVEERIKKLAKILVDYSAKVRKGERVVVNGDVIAEPLIKEVYKLLLKKGAYPAVHAHLPGMSEIYFKTGSKAQLEKFPEVAMFETKKTDVFIGIYGTSNTRQLSSVDPKKMAMRSKTTNPISKERMKKRWVLCNYPTNALAMEGDMSLTDYEDWFYTACNVDYAKMQKKHEKLRKLLQKGKTVRIVGENTDLTLSIKGMTAKNQQGIYNVPDGEVFIAPEKSKTEGHIQFSYPAIRAGNEVDGIYVEFKKGKAVVVKATKNEKFLKSMLATDKGASYLGELGVGTNYKITRYTKNLLFDEKIGGTVHLAFGMAYPDTCDKNKKEGNKSALHWDIVKDMRKGGRLYIDGKLVQKNGKFLI
ncbi:aminopeptidase [Nanoarchaeota archaeon]